MSGLDLSLADRVHGNLMDVYSWMGEAPGGAVDYQDGELLFAGRSPLPFLNGALRSRSDSSAAELLRRAREFFFARERGFVTFCWPGDPALEQAALEAEMFPVMARYPEMVCRQPMARIDGHVQQVTSTEDAVTYWTICDAAYPSIGFPERLFSEAFNPEELLDQRVWACLGIDDGRPVACASVWTAGGVGFLGWVAALPESRGKGLAAACTVAAVNQALKDGSDVVSLQASQMGEDLYRRLGFEEIFAYRLLGAMPG
jgi:GNAT superfamily N-acetyltransferase